MENLSGNHLPIENIRDLINIIRQDIKYKYCPFRFYYKYRAKKYAKYKTPELNLIQYLVNKNENSVDIGANLGLFTYFLSKYSKNVFAFEPSPNPLRYLPRLIDSNVRLYQIAISNEDQIMELLIPKSQKGWSSNGATLKKIDVKNGMKINVDCKTIDSFNFSKIGLIKIDVEGAEKEVLEGAKNTINKFKPNLIIENEIIHQKNTNDLFSIIADFDYEIYYLEAGKLININDQLDIHHLQKKPESKLIGYIQNFICINKLRKEKFEKINLF